MKRSVEKVTPDVPGQIFFAFTDESAASPDDPARPPGKSVSTPAPRAELTFRASDVPVALSDIKTCEAGQSFMTEARVAEIFLDVAAQRRPGQVKAARVAFYPFRATLYSFKITRQGVAKVKFHQAFRGAAETVFSQAAHLMLIRRAADRRAFYRAEYDFFVRAMPPSAFEMPGARKTRRVSLAVPGAHRSLEESFKRVNAEYFQSQLEQPELCWSPVRARRILGSYQERSNRLIISQVFDSPKVPLFVLDYLMYHELLHKFLGIGRRHDGKRCMHGREFRELEQKYRQFGEAQVFLKKL